MKSRLAVVFEKEKLKFIFLCTALFYFAVHGYRFLNNLHTSDCLVVVFQDDIYWQRSLGRFLQPLWLVLRGTICAPWLIGCISCVLFGTAFCFLFDILQIRNKLGMACSIGLLLCNSTLISAISSFLPWVDIYAAAFLLAVLGVWFFLQDDWKGYLLGILALVCCMGFYQAYLDTALALFVMVGIRWLWSGENLKKVWIRTGKILAGVGVSGVLYFAAYKMVCRIHHVEEANSYNSLSGVGDFAGSSFGNLIAGTYGKFFGFLLHPGKFASTWLMGISISGLWEKVLAASAVICLCAVIFGVILINYRKKASPAAWVLQFAALFLFPFAANFVYFLSKGMEHELMIHSFFLLWVFLLEILQEEAEGRRQTERIMLPGKMAAAVCTVLLGILLWNNIVYGNQMYFKIDMEDRAALSLATRLLQDIEDVEGYEPGVTPVLLAGSPEQSPTVRNLAYLSEVQSYGSGKTPFIYGNAMQFYLDAYLNGYIRFSDAAAPEEILREMPVYPAKGSLRLEDGTIIVKLAP